MSPVLASILAIGFWVLAALAIVTLMSFVYVEIQYYRWNKDEREKEELTKTVVDVIEEKAKEIKEEITK